MKIKVGMKVKVGEHSDVVYTVDEINGFIAKLSYETEVGGEVVSGGYMDVSCLVEVK
jgi:hypothetical protein